MAVRPPFGELMVRPARLFDLHVGTVLECGAALAPPSVVWCATRKARGTVKPSCDIAGPRLEPRVSRERRGSG